MPENNEKKKGVLSPMSKKLGLGETTVTVAPPRRLQDIAQDNGPLGLGSLTGMAMDRRRQTEETPEEKRKRKFKGIQDTGVDYA